MKKSTYIYNEKGQLNGYAEEYDAYGLWCRTNYKNGREIGYEEVNLKPKYTIGQKGTNVNFHIR